MQVAVYRCKQLRIAQVAVAIQHAVWLCNRWVMEASLIYMENVQDVTFLPDNSFINEAGCQLGNYEQPILLGNNSLTVTGPGRLIRT